MSTGHGDVAATVVYEVNLELDPGIADAYRAWLQRHMREILTLPGFIDARLCEPLEPPADRSPGALSVQYTLRDADALAAYLRDHAPRLRADGVARFGDRVRASRRVLRVLDRASVDR